MEFAITRSPEEFSKI